MKAVFLDAATFSIELKSPDSLSDYQSFDLTGSENLIIERAKDADILITNKVQISAQIMDALPKLKLIQIAATGTNNVDLEAAKARNIKVLNVSGYSTKSVPEHTFMMILTILRAGMHYHKLVGAPWIEDGKFCLLDCDIFDLHDKTLGIVGAGNIGSRVAQITKAFGANVLISERINKEPRSGRVAFERVLEESDIICLHCPLCEETEHLINKNTISKMKKRPIIINAARGGVVDVNAISEAIKNEKILGFGSDVFECEPIDAQNPLLELKDHPRVFLTPHNAWASQGAQRKSWEIICAQINDFVLQTRAQ
ncbi:MAG: D-2-hydroxyacid dehydrogenase [Helicobacter sp.]|nr:D-2-hydroxyacid dehydrogenase [Helicobacter sp.]